MRFFGRDTYCLKKVTSQDTFVGAAETVEINNGYANNQAGDCGTIFCSSYVFTSVTKERALSTLATLGECGAGLCLVTMESEYGAERLLELGFKKLLEGIPNKEPYDSGDTRTLYGYVFPMQEPDSDFDFYKD